MCSLAYVGSAKNAESLRIRRHDAVLDPIVNHLNEMAGAVRPAMQVTLLGSTLSFFTSGCGRNIAGARSQRRKDWVEVLDDALLAADHHAVPSLEPPNTAARSHVYIMDALRREFFGSPDIVDVIRIAAVDEDVLRFEMRQEIRDTLVPPPRRDHNPH